MEVFASHFIRCELVVWCTTEHTDTGELGGKVTLQNSDYNQVAFEIMNIKQNCNSVFSSQCRNLKKSLLIIGRTVR